MSSGSVLKARFIIGNTSKSGMGDIVDSVLQKSSSEEVEQLLDENLQQILKDIV